MPVGQIVTSIVVVLLAATAVHQLRKPSRWLGMPILAYMNLSHSALTDWGMRHIDVKENYTVLDVGCGGGRTVKKLATMAPLGKVFGVDYAGGSVAGSRTANAKLIAAGRVEIMQASVSELPFAEATFDVVTAIETQYYWPSLVDDMKEISRVLKPGGTLMVVAETYRRKGGAGTLDAAAMILLRGKVLSVDDQVSLFMAAGYTSIETWEEPSKGWMCASGRKPIQP